MQPHKEVVFTTFPFSIVTCLRKELTVPSKFDRIHPYSHPGMGFQGGKIFDCPSMFYTISHNIFNLPITILQIYPFHLHFQFMWGFFLHLLVHNSCISEAVTLSWFMASLASQQFPSGHHYTKRNTYQFCLSNTQTQRIQHLLDTAQFLKFQNQTGYCHPHFLFHRYLLFKNQQQRRLSFARNDTTKRNAVSVSIFILNFIYVHLLFFFLGLLRKLP